MAADGDILTFIVLQIKDNPWTASGVLEFLRDCFFLSNIRFRIKMLANRPRETFINGRSFFIANKTGYSTIGSGAAVTIARSNDALLFAINYHYRLDC